jgi:MFS family permease
MTDSLFCTNHPDTETMLRCNRCEKPICGKCAVLTDTGYRCKECVRGQQKVFETAEVIDYPIAFVVAALLSFIGGLIAPRLSFFVILLAPIAGTMVAETVRFSIRKRRAKNLFLTAAAGALIGSLPGLIGQIIALNLLGMLWYGIYSAVVTTTVYYRLRGMVFKR